MFNSFYLQSIELNVAEKTKTYLPTLTNNPEYSVFSGFLGQFFFFCDGGGAKAKLSLFYHVPRFVCVEWLHDRADSLFGTD